MRAESTGLSFVCRCSGDTVLNYGVGVLFDAVRCSGGGTLSAQRDGNRWASRTTGKGFKKPIGVQEVKQCLGVIPPKALQKIVKAKDRVARLVATAVQRAGQTNTSVGLIEEPTESVVATYLLTWNPNSWPWENLEAVVAASAAGRPVDDEWSCGNTKRIRIGDRLFLFRQGGEPRGIIAAGWATTMPYHGAHLDVKRRSNGDTARFVGVQFERVLNPDFDEILRIERLRDGPLASVNWFTPACGIEKREGGEVLERMWAELLQLYLLNGEEEANALEGDLRLALSRHRARERWLREKKIAAAKAANGGRLPCEVSV